MSRKNFSNSHEMIVDAEDKICAAMWVRLVHEQDDSFQKELKKAARILSHVLKHIKQRMIDEESERVKRKNQRLLWEQKKK